MLPLAHDTALRLTPEIYECIEDKTKTNISITIISAPCVGLAISLYIAPACGTPVQLSVKSPDKIKLPGIELTFYHIPSYFVINHV